MKYSHSGTVLTKDLVTVDGRRLASRGEIVDIARLKAVALKAPRGLRERTLFETYVAEAELVVEAFDKSPLQHLLGGESRRRVRAATALAEVRFPQPIWAELQALRKEDAPRYQHAIWTSVIVAHLFQQAMGEQPGMHRLVGGALTHDLGMRQVAATLRFKQDHLTRADALALECHPLLGALVLASVLGDAPAVQFALLHHTRAGFNYGRAGNESTLRELDLISVASAFAALIAPRSYRLLPYNPRGAVDQLVDDAVAGQFDLRAIRLLIRCLRSTKPDANLRFPRKLTGFRPPVNHYGMAAGA